MKGTKNGWSRKPLSAAMVVALLLAVSTARADDGGRPESPAAPRLLVVWHDAHGLYPGPHGGVAREVASLFAPLELEVHWRRAERYDPPLDERTMLLRIVLMPSDPSGAGWGLKEDVMGAVLPSNGRARSVYIFYKALVRGLKMKLREGRIPDFRDRKLLERALGRVVAHEMVHAVAPAVRHAERGLMGSGVTRSFLAQEDVVVSEPLRRAFVTGVERILSTTTTALAPRPGGPAAPRAVRTSLEAPGAGEVD